MSGPARNEDKVNTFAIVVVGLVSAIVVWASVVLLQAYYQNTAGAAEEERQAVGQNDTVRSLRAEQRASLAEARYVTDAAGARMASIPLEAAKAKVLADAQKQAPSLVPRVAAHNVPSIPAMPGKPKPLAAPPVDAPAAGTPGDSQEKDPAKATATPKEKPAQ